MGKHIKDGYLPTAKDFYYKHTTTGNDPGKNTLNLMIQFAKLHVEAALKEASENAEQKWIKFTENDYEIDKDSILNAYPLENIK